MRIIEYFRAYAPLSFTSLSFIYVVLPLFVIIYSLVPNRLKPGALLGLSVLYYLLAQPTGIALLAASVVTDYVAVRVMKKKDGNESARRICMWFSVAKNLIIIAGSGIYSRAGGIPPFLGTVVYALSGMSAVIDMYKREYPYELDFIKFSLYCCFFPRLYAGPLINCRDFCAQLTRPKQKGMPMFGTIRFIAGAVKAFVFGKQLSVVYTGVRAIPIENVSVVSSWVLVLVFALAIYYVLSGYCDMAKGMGEMLGIELPKNFYYPYQSRGAGDFFERFNITVGGFAYKYVYKNLGGDEKGLTADFANIAVTAMLTGLWFGFRLNYVIWGACLAIFIFTGKYLMNRTAENIPLLLRRCFTLCAVLSSFTILLADNIEEYYGIIKSLFGFFTDMSFANNSIMYILSSNWLMLAAACFFATNIVDMLLNWLSKLVPRAFSGLCGAAAILIMGVYTSLALQ